MKLKYKDFEDYRDSNEYKLAKSVIYDLESGGNLIYVTYSLIDKVFPKLDIDDLVYICNINTPLTEDKFIKESDNTYYRNIYDDDLQLTGEKLYFSSYLKDNIDKLQYLLSDIEWLALFLSNNMISINDLLRFDCSKEVD